MTTLGAFIIARNEEESIAEAVRSLQPHVSQLVVVDTGSTDSTALISTRLGAEMHFCRWSDDFSAARNFAIERMRTDWILSLDADERLDGSGLAAVTELLNSTRLGGVRVCIRNYLSDQSGKGQYQEHRYTRIFRRNPAIRYRGAIHEQIAGSIETAGFDIVDSAILIHHLGYVEASPQKIQRNIALLRTALAEQPGDSWLQYHLGISEFAAGNVAAAENMLHAALGGDSLSTEQRELAMLRLAQIALAAENWNEVEKRISFVGSDEQREGFRRFIAGVSLAMQGRFAEALTMLDSPSVGASGLVDKQQYQSLIGLCRQQHGG